MSDPLPPLALTLVVITRDAGASLAKCLSSARFASQMIVVDSGSGDDTAQIAASCGALVIEQAWLGFGPQKNFAVAQAANDWVLCLDADEFVSPELARSIRSTLQQARFNAYEMPRRNRFLGKWLGHGEGYPDWNVRLFDRRHARWSEDAVHEHVLFDGNVGRLSGDLLHTSRDALAACLAKPNPSTTVPAEARVAVTACASTCTPPALHPTLRVSHLAHRRAQPRVRYTLGNPAAYRRNNVDAFSAVLQGCRHSGIEHLGYASSSSVYGANHTR